MLLQGTEPWSPVALSCSLFGKAYSGKEITNNGGGGDDNNELT